MKILYLGSETGTSGHRANALRRLGHSVQILNPYNSLPKLPFTGVLQRYLGSVGLASVVRSDLLRRVAGSSFDLVWVDGGALISRATVIDLKKIATRVLNHNVDDPLGSRDVNHWAQYRHALCAYDLAVVVRKENVEEAYSRGARKVLLVFRSADEVAHAPRKLTGEEKVKWASDVLFVGTGFPERGPLFTELIRLGVPLSIYGNSWNRLKEWRLIQPFWKGPGLDDQYSYSTAILAAKVCLGLLSKGNRDLHTTRSLEIPSLGGVFCAERTEEHLALYEEGKEAVFWGSPEECAAKCRALLTDEPWRQSVAANGHQRYLANGWTNMKVAEKILRVAFE